LPLLQPGAIEPAPATIATLPSSRDIKVFLFSLREMLFLLSLPRLRGRVRA
jgi:hypothetical protein